MMPKNYEVVFHFFCSISQEVFWFFNFQYTQSVNRMSHWRHWVTEGTKFWISCKWPAFLSNFSCLQIVQHSVPSVTRRCQCDIQILLIKKMTGLARKNTFWHPLNILYWVTPLSLDNGMQCTCKAAPKIKILILLQVHQQVVPL